MTTLAERQDLALRHPSPPLAVLAAVHVVLFLASIAVTAAINGGEHIPSLSGRISEVVAFFFAEPTAMRWNAFLLLGSAVPLLLFSAVVSSRLAFLGLQAAGVTIGFAGGLVAAAALGLSALVEWVLSATAPSQESSRGLQLLFFGMGGPLHVMALGLLLAGVSVTSRLARLLPDWLTSFGLVVAVIAELTWLVLVVPEAALLLPVARLASYVWLIAVGVLLPESVSPRAPGGTA